MLQQLNALEREDRTLRQKALATMPVSKYYHAHACTLYSIISYHCMCMRQRTLYTYTCTCTFFTGQCVPAGRTQEGSGEGAAERYGTSL